MGDVFLVRRTVGDQPVPRDVDAAQAWYRKAADQGEAEAECDLGEMYAYFDATPDYAQSIPWFRKAADQGYGIGQFRLGQMYALGKGVARDDVEAYKWFALADAATDHRYPAADFVADIAQGMTPDQITEAKARVAAWAPAGQAK